VFVSLVEERCQMDESAVDGFILATDGFDYSLLGLDEKQVYELVNKNGVESVVVQIGQVQESDPLCNKYPRFKKADDLTVICLNYR
jgi:hypothetical protein